MAAVSTTDGTYLTNLFNPQVVADLIDSQLISKIAFAPLARIDNTLQGTAGNTVTLPYYSYIGPAQVVLEGQDIPISQLSQSTTQVTIQKIAKACQITDEAVLSGYGDPIGEAVKQITQSIADKLDNMLMAALNGNTESVYYTGASGQAVAPSDIPLALAMFGENGDGQKVLIADSDMYAQLLKTDWIPASQIAAEVRISGTVGMAYGCQVIVSDRVKNNALHIVKPGSLAIFMKRDTLIEIDRDIVNESTVIKGSKLFAPYLLNPKQAIKLVADTAP